VQLARLVNAVKPIFASRTKGDKLFPDFFRDIHVNPENLGVSKPLIGRTLPQIHLVKDKLWTEVFNAFSDPATVVLSLSSQGSELIFREKVVI
jgi:hypothetical protein